MATKPMTTLSTPAFTTTSPNSTSNTTRMLKKFKWVPPTSSFWEAAFRSVMVTSSLEAVLIIATNVLLFLVIVTSPKLRGRLRNQLVLSLVVANLLVGVFSAPFAVDVTVRRDWVHGCYLFVVLTLLTMYVQNFVTVWGVTALLLHYAARLLRYEGPGWVGRLPTPLQRAAPGLFVATPWVASVVLSIPIVFGGMHKVAWAIWNDTRCPIILQGWATSILNAISFFIPAAMLLVLIVLIIVLHRRRDRPGADMPGRAEMGATLVSEDKEDTESCWVHVLVAALTVLMMGPEHTFLVARLQVKGPWKSIVIASVLVNLLSDLTPFVLALVWLLMLPDVRRRVSELVTSCCAALPSFCRTRTPPQSSGNTTIAPVAFRDLQDE